MGMYNVGFPDLARVLSLATFLSNLTASSSIGTVLLAKDGSMTS